VFETTKTMRNGKGFTRV